MVKRNERKAYRKPEHGQSLSTCEPSSLVCKMVVILLATHEALSG